jgi:tellurite resistance protein TehA-like permease
MRGCLRSAVLWVITQYAFLAGVSEGRTKPSLEQGFSGQWLLLVVSTQGLATLGAEVLAQPDPSAALTFACCALVLLGAIYYVLLGSIILYRFVFVAMPAQDITGPWWINEGAAAITVLAMAKLMMIPELKVGSFVVRQLLGPFVIGFWADATFWIPLLVLLFAWKHLMRGQILCYSVALWPVVFPLGMYSAATLALADIFQLPFLHVIGRVFFWIAFVAWCGVLVGALQSIGIPTIRRS